MFLEGGVSEAWGGVGGVREWYYQQGRLEFQVLSAFFITASSTLSDSEIRTTKFSVLH